MSNHYTASSSNPDQENHQLTLYVTKGVTGAYVGHLKEIPAIIIQSETENGLELEANISVNLYWKEFPEDHDKLFPSHVKASKESEILQENLHYRTIELTVPPF